MCFGVYNVFLRGFVLIATKPTSLWNSISRHPQKNMVGRDFSFKNQSPEAHKTSGVSGAATQIRTGDLILTKDVLYQLSHSSKSKDISS